MSGAVDNSSPGNEAERPPPADGHSGPLAPSQAERAASARARGLSAPYISGGRDPEPDEGLRQDRFYGRLLILMVAVIVLAGFVLGIIANIMGLVGAD